MTEATVEGLIEFVHGEPGDRGVDHLRWETCICGNYLHSIGNIDSDNTSRSRRAAADFADFVEEENPKVFYIFNLDTYLSAQKELVRLGYQKEGQL